jgi:hypothetical protein
MRKIKKHAAPVPMPASGRGFEPDAEPVTITDPQGEAVKRRTLKDKLADEAEARADPDPWE